MNLGVGKSKTGFVLIELLLVVGIIGALSSIVILSVNPQKQITAAQDANRNNAAREIQNALSQGLLNNVTFTLPTTVATAIPICKQSITTVTSCLNIDALVPIIIAKIPRDSTEACPNFAGFSVYKKNGFITVVSAQLGRYPGNPYYNPTCHDGEGPPEISIEVSEDGGPATNLTSGVTFEPADIVVGSTKTLTFTVRNVGTGPLSLPSNPTLPDTPFSLDTTGFTTGALSTGGSRTFTVLFVPSEDGEFSSTITLANDDSNENPFSIVLTAGARANIPQDMVIWLDANRPSKVRNPSNSPASNGEGVATWTDLMGTATVVQADQNQDPIYTTGISPSGKPGLFFEKKFMATVGSPALFPGNETDFTVFVVTSPQSKQVSYAKIFDYDSLFNTGKDMNFMLEQEGDTGNESFYHLGYWNGSWTYIAEDQPIPALESFSYLTYRKDGQILRYNVNGTQVGLQKGETLFLTEPRTFSVGNNARNTDQSFLGTISEIIIYNRALDDTEIGTVEQYLSAKYGI